MTYASIWKFGGHHATKAFDAFYYILRISRPAD